jgi:hypothetical protein
MARSRAVSTDGFHLDFKLTGARRERMEKRIDWLLNSNPEQRRHDRFSPKQAASHISLADGREYACEVIDISVSGAAIKCHVLPSIGTYVNLGKMRGRVVRYTSDGFAIEFLRKMDPSKLELHATVKPKRNTDIFQARQSLGPAGFFMFFKRLSHSRQPFENQLASAS